MLNVKRLIKTSILCYFPLLLFSLNVSLVNASTNLDDNFDDGSLDGWQVVKDPDRTLCNAPWSIVNGRLSISINQTNCTTNLLPSDMLWGEIGDNYIIEVDAWFVNGIDHAIAFRFVPATPKNNWYDFHFLSPSTIVLERVPTGNISNTLTYPVPNRTNPYHLKIIVDEGNIVLFIDNVQVMNYQYDPSNDIFTTGKFAFRSGTGSNAVSITQFDNLKITKIDKSLKINHLSQVDPEWKSQEYDTASAYNPVGWREIEDWGCALTSSAMVLNYHGYANGPNGQQTNPSTLNTWLKTNNGYNRYGSIIWNYISRYAYLSQANGHVSGKPNLEFSYAPYDFDTVKQDYQANIPDIIKIVTNNQSTPTHNDDNLHFVVSNNIDNTNVLINDPLDLVKSQVSLQTKYSGKEFRQLARFLPSNTDLSYIWIHQYTPGVNTLLSYNNQTLGTNPQGITTNQLPNGQFFWEGVITAPDFTTRFGGNTSQYFTLLLPKPDTGTYQLLFSSPSDTFVDYELHLFDQQGKPNLYKHKDFIDDSLPIEFTLVYNKSGQTSNLVKKMSFDQLIADIHYAYGQKMITHPNTKAELLSYINLAKKYYPENNPGWKLAMKQVEQALKKYKGKSLTNPGYTFLFGEFSLLKSQL